MNILINTSRLKQEQLKKDNKIPGKSSTLGERFAMAILIFYTTSALIISGWSALVIQSGNIDNGGPIGLFIQILKTSGIV